MNTPLLFMRNITKVYGRNIVLDNVDFTLRRLSIHALIGENGSGKSTLVNILSGMIACDSGKIMLDDIFVDISSPLKAIEQGICLVSQDNTLMENMTVAENIFLNHELFYGKTRFISWNKVNHVASRILLELGVDIKPEALVSSLTHAERKIVEMARCLVYKTRILILDEPTSTMSEADAEHLFTVMRNLKNKGISIIYISHRLYEVNKIADDITILRDGRVADSFSISDYDKNRLIETVVGKNVVERYPKLKVDIGTPLLSVRNICVRKLVKDISFDLHEGEILGIWGLRGSGKITLGKALFGLERITDGQIYFGEKIVRLRNPSDAVRNGVAYLSSELDMGVANEVSVQKNIITPALESVKTFSIIPNFIEKTARKYFKLMKIKDISLHDKMYKLSSGAKRKVMFAKWLSSDAKVFILNDPTSAIDVSSKIDIYNTMNGIVKTGGAIILISTELSELLGMADRILVLSEGEIIKEVYYKKSTREDIMLASASKIR